MRRWLAKLLCPEAFEDAERYAYLRRRLTELQDWCGNEAPEIDHAIIWAKKSEHVHFMSLVEMDAVVDAGDWPATAVGSIDQFREEMRQRAKAELAA